MNTMRFHVRYTDGTELEVRPIPKARRAFEHEFEVPLTEAVASGRSDWADFIVHQTLVIRQDETRTLDEWMNDLDELWLLVDDPKATKPAAAKAAAKKPSARARKAN